MRRDDERGGEGHVTNLLPWDMLRSDRALRTMFAVLVTLLMVMLTISSCVIWPAVFSLRAIEDAAVAKVCGSLASAALPMLAVDTMIAVVLSWFDTRYSFVKCLIATYIIGIVGMMIVLFALPGDLLAVSEFTLAIRAIQVIGTLLLSVLLAFLPALVSTVLGWLIREVYYVIAEIRR